MSSVLVCCPGKAAISIRGNLSAPFFEQAKEKKEKRKKNLSLYLSFNQLT